MVYRSLFDGTEDDDSSYTAEELPELKRDAKERLRLWANRLIISGLAFVLSCSAVVPFLYGHSLHEHWDPFGKYLLFLPLVLLPPFIGCAILTFIAWIFLRSWEKRI
jgi:hypothetical protein